MSGALPDKPARLEERLQRVYMHRRAARRFMACFERGQRQRFVPCPLQQALGLLLGHLGRRATPGPIGQTAQPGRYPSLARVAHGAHAQRLQRGNLRAGFALRQQQHAPGTFTNTPFRMLFLGLH